MSEHTDAIEEPDEYATCKRCGKDDCFWVVVYKGQVALYENRPHGSIAPHTCNHSLQFEDLV